MVNTRPDLCVAFIVDQSPGASGCARLAEEAGIPTLRNPTAEGIPAPRPAAAELRNTAGALGWLIDTRAHGGYVVAAGSTVAGNAYTVQRDDRPGDLPAWLAERLRPAPLRPAGPPVVVELPADRHGAYVRAAITGTLAKLAEAHEGGRNRALFMAAQTLGQLVAGGAVVEDTVTAVLADAAARIGLGPREIETTIRSGLAAGARRPRRVAA
jgi:hypothetical protein